jgi:hypothetical protein
VSERLVSKAATFYSLLALEGRGLVFRRVFLICWWLINYRLIIPFLFKFIVTLRFPNELIISRIKNHDGKPSMRDMQSRPLVHFWKVSFTLALLYKLLAA